MLVNMHLESQLGYSNMCYSLGTSDRWLHKYPQVWINCSRTWLSPARLLEAHKGGLSYFSLKNQIFFLDILLFTIHELFKARFPGGVITFRTPQPAVSEGPAVIAPKKRKRDRESSLSGFYFDKAILLERVDVSTPTCSHNKFVSIYPVNKHSNVNVSLYIQMRLSIINSCCKEG